MAESMNQTKLITLLKSLDKREMLAFKKYVESPFFNVNREIISFLNTVIHFHKKDTAQIRELHRKHHKNNRISLQTTRYLMTDLTRLLEGFIIHRELQRDPWLQQTLLLKGFYKRRADKYFGILHHQILTKQQANAYRDNRYAENRYKLAELSYEFYSIRDNRSADNDLQDLSDQLDHFYMGTKLKYACEMMNRTNILMTDYQQPFLPTLLVYLGKNTAAPVPSIAVYQQIYKTLASPEQESNFKSLMKTIQQHFEKFSLRELRDIYAFAQNYCIRKVNTGRTVYLRELFNIYNFILENKIIFDNDELSHAEFKNICTIALRCEELKWTENFIEKYASSLRADLRKNSVNYNMARVHFSKKEYRTALKLLTGTEFTDVYYHLDAKSLLLKVYYETSDIEPLLSLFSSFRIYLKRSKLISEYQRTIYTNQIRFVKKLIKVNVTSKKALAKLTDEVEKNKEIADYGWVLEKTTELSNF